MATPEEYGKKGTPLQHTRQSMILERLNNGMALSITELAREWDVSTKTLQRDFDKLNTMLPGQIERADDGKRYRKSKNYTAYNDGEIIIEMLDSLVRSIGGATYTKAHKLLSELKSHIDKPFYARIDVEDISDKFEIVATLEKAMAEKRAITIDYHRWYDDDGNKSYKDVHPLKIVVYNGFWYLLAEHDGYFKKFYLKEIHTCDFEDHTFTPDKKIIDQMENSVNVWFEPNNEPFEVTLWLDTDVVVYFERKPIAKNQKLYKKSDGTAELIVKITHKEEIFPIVKFWLPTVRIIEPEHLQESFETMLKDYLTI
jgi:predicted DNA-binding transcriptional regulator YafY